MGHHSSEKEPSASPSPSPSPSPSTDPSPSKHAKKEHRSHKSSKKESKVKEEKTHRSPKKAKPEKEAKKSKSRSSSKGGGQWTEWKRPFKDGSTTDEAFKLCLVKGGIKKKDFDAKVKKLHGDAKWLRNRFHRGNRAEWTWEFSDDNGRYVITHVKLHSSKKAA